LFSRSLQKCLRWNRLVGPHLSGAESSSPTLFIAKHGQFTAFARPQHTNRRPTKRKTEGSSCPRPQSGAPTLASPEDRDSLTKIKESVSDSGREGRLAPQQKDRTDNWINSWFLEEPPPPYHRSWRPSRCCFNCVRSPAEAPSETRP
jgi:hypothetical protein